MRLTTGETNRRTVLRGIGTAAFAGWAIGIAGATGSRATQEVDTSLPPGAVLFDLDGDGAYDATVERAPESLADDDRPNPIRITSQGRTTVDYAASVVEPEDRPALGDLDRLAYDYRAVPDEEAESRAFGVADGAFAQTAETTDGGGGDGDDPTTEDDENADDTETPDDGESDDGDGEDGDGGGGDIGGGGDGGGGDGDGNDGGFGDAGGAGAPDETFLVVENDEGRHGMYLTYHDDAAGEEWRTHDVLARATGDTAETTGWFEYTADGEETFDDVVARYGADARLVRVGVGHGDGVTPTTLGVAYGGLVVNDRRYRFPVEVARRSASAPLGEQK